MLHPRKAPQGPAPLELENFPQRPCLALMRAECPEGGVLSPSASSLLVSPQLTDVSEQMWLIELIPPFSTFRWVPELIARTSAESASRCLNAGALVQDSERSTVLSASISCASILSVHLRVARVWPPLRPAVRTAPHSGLQVVVPEAPRGWSRRLGPGKRWRTNSRVSWFRGTA